MTVVLTLCYSYKLLHLDLKNFFETVILVFQQVENVTLDYDSSRERRTPAHRISAGWGDYFLYCL